MNDYFNIYIDRLRGGATERIERIFSPEFLDVNESDISFPKDVVVDGNAYITDNNLVLQMNISTSVIQPCTICNGPVEVPIELKGLYTVVPIDEIKGGVFKMQEMLRENILLEVPLFVECNSGHCPNRGEIEKYLHHPETEVDDAEEGYQPFKDL